MKNIKLFLLLTLALGAQAHGMQRAFSAFRAASRLSTAPLRSMMANRITASPCARIFRPMVAPRLGQRLTGLGVRSFATASGFRQMAPKFTSRMAFPGGLGLTSLYFMPMAFAQGENGSGQERSLHSLRDLMTNWAWELDSLTRDRNEQSMKVYNKEYWGGKCLHEREILEKLDQSKKEKAKLLQENGKLCNKMAIEELLKKQNVEPLKLNSFGSNVQYAGCFDFWYRDGYTTSNPMHGFSCEEIGALNLKHTLKMARTELEAEQLFLTRYLGNYGVIKAHPDYHAKKQAYGKRLAVIKQDLQALDAFERNMLPKLKSVLKRVFRDDEFDKALDTLYWHEIENKKKLQGNRSLFVGVTSRRSSVYNKQREQYKLDEVN